MKPDSYRSYRDTGVPWFPRAPHSWRVQPLHACALERSEKNADLREKNLLSLSYGRIVRKDIASNDGLLPESFDTYQVIYPGDLVLRLTDLQNDQRSLRSAIAPERGMITSAYLALRPGTMDPQYLAHQFRAIDVCKVLYSMGGGLRQSLKFSDLKHLPLLCPPLEEQRVISAFLDRETANIDALIVEQERLIALLHEKRLAVISHAVTKGLDAKVPMKPSGIQWIGDVPAHWSAGPVVRLAKLESGHTPSRSHPEYWEDCTIPWVTLGDIWQVRDGRKETIDDTAERISELGAANSAARVLPSGTVMLSRTASVGFSAVMGTEMATTQDFANWVCGSQLEPFYLLYCFRAMSGEFVRLKMGSTHNTIYMPDIQKLAIPVPPRVEQGVIVSMIRARTGQIDELIDSATSGIGLLAERRTALITAAVTGQIDVRGLVDPAA